jgi:hypothetical protein
MTDPSTPVDPAKELGVSARTDGGCAASGGRPCRALVAVEPCSGASGESAVP